MIDPPRIANLLSAGQHNLNYFVKKRKIKCVKCVKDRSYLDLMLNSMNLFQRNVLQQEGRINNQILGVRGQK